VCSTADSTAADAATWDEEELEKGENEEEGKGADVAAADIADEDNDEV